VAAIEVMAAAIEVVAVAVEVMVAVIMPGLIVAGAHRFHLLFCIVRDG
jgi:hypothetical protein